MCIGDFRNKNPENALNYVDQLTENAQHWDMVETFKLYVLQNLRKTMVYKQNLHP